ncbi:MULTISPECIES: hypothetical protein [unclassified Mesorhizobium]
MGEWTVAELEQRGQRVEIEEDTPHLYRTILDAIVHFEPGIIE